MSLQQKGNRKFCHLSLRINSANINCLVLNLAYLNVCSFLNLLTITTEYDRLILVTVIHGHGTPILA
jgi:hypothetical protein